MPCPAILRGSKQTSIIRRYSTAGRLVDSRRQTRRHQEQTTTKREDVWVPASIHTFIAMQYGRFRNTTSHDLSLSLSLTLPRYPRGWEIIDEKYSQVKPKYSTVQVQIAQDLENMQQEFVIRHSVQQLQQSLSGGTLDAGSIFTLSRENPREASTTNHRDTKPQEVLAKPRDLLLPHRPCS